MKFCDIVIVTNEIQAWRSAFKSYYGQNIITERNIQDAIQVQIKEVATINFYVSSSYSKRLMIQPAKPAEQKLLAVLRNIPEIRQRAARESPDIILPGPAQGWMDG